MPNYSYNLFIPTNSNHCILDKKLPRITHPIPMKVKSDRKHDFSDFGRDENRARKLKGSIRDDAGMMNDIDTGSKRAKSKSVRFF